MEDSFALSSIFHPLSSILILSALPAAETSHKLPPKLPQKRTIAGHNRGEDLHLRLLHFLDAATNSKLHFDRVAA